MFLKISQNSHENTCAGVSTYQFNSQRMDRLDKRTSSHWRCSVKKAPVLESFLIKLQQIRPATLLKIDSNTDVFL